VFVFFARLILVILYKIIPIKRNYFQNINILLFAFIIALGMAEIFLRIFFTGLNSYGEKVHSGHYGSPFYDVLLRECDSCNKDYFFINSPNSSFELRNSEYHYRHIYNSLGLRDREFNLRKKSDEFRIIGLGDSFVEGMGTSGDSTWLKQLEYKLNQGAAGLKYVTMNGGKGGSDLFFSYDLLTRCLVKYKPDLVILNLNSTDVGDIMCRGGYERYDSKGNCHPKEGGPWWEFFFGASYIVRLIVLNVLHYNWQLQPKIAELKALSEISKKISDYQGIAKKEHFAFLLVLQPLQSELNEQSSFTAKLKIDSGIRNVDLTSILVDKIKEQHGKTSLFYYPLDGHFNARGYGVEADAIYNTYFKSDYQPDSIAVHN